MESVLLFVLSSFLLVSTLACTCDNQNEKERFCNADWAIRTTIWHKRAIADPAKHKYAINLTATTYLGPKNCSLNFTNINVYGLSESKDCAKLLCDGAEYVIAGHYMTPGYAYFDVCFLVKRWDTLDRDQIEAFYDYEDTCEDVRLKRSVDEENEPN